MRDRDERLYFTFGTFSHTHIAAFIRQWVTEGVPAIFAEQPFLYEEIRAWMGSRCMVPPKCFSLVGSARFGFSLSKGNYGRAFTPDSDLDFTCVDLKFFTACVGDANRWRDDYSSGVAVPTSQTERGFWEQNKNQLAMHITKGFIQTNRVPAMRKYAKIQEVLNSMSLIPRKLESTLNAPKPSRASLRVYRDWDALTAQVALNLRTALL